MKISIQLKAKDVKMKQKNIEKLKKRRKSTKQKYRKKW